MLEAVRQWIHVREARALGLHVRKANRFPHAGTRPYYSIAIVGQYDQIKQLLETLADMDVLAIAYNLEYRLDEAGHLLTYGTSLQRSLEPRFCSINLFHVSPEVWTVGINDGEIPK